MRLHVAKELRTWVKTFPVDFYRQIYRLNRWRFNEDNNARPGVIGRWTNNIVHKRLASGVWVELIRLTPRLESGRLKNKLFQRLTENFGHPKMREHFAGVMILMKYATNWRVFMDVGGGHGRAELPGDDVTREVVEPVDR